MTPKARRTLSRLQAFERGINVPEGVNNLLPKAVNKNLHRDVVTHELDSDEHNRWIVAPHCPGVVAIGTADEHTPTIIGDDEQARPQSVEHHLRRRERVAIEMADLVAEVPERDDGDIDTTADSLSKIVLQVACLVGPDRDEEIVAGSLDEFAGAVDHIGPTANVMDEIGLRRTSHLGQGRGQRFDVVVELAA